MYAGMQVTVWFWGVLSEISLSLCEPTPFFLDSQSAEDLAMNPVYHKSEDCGPISGYFYQGLDCTGLRVSQKKRKASASVTEDNRRKRPR